MYSTFEGMQAKISGQQQSINYDNYVMKHVDQYVIFRELLGKGSFSVVHKAMDKNDPSHTRIFAAKIIALNNPIVQSQEYKVRLQKEIDILVKAKHKNLIQLYDMKQTPNNVYLFTDYANQGDLRKFLKQQGDRLSEMQSLDFFK